MSTPVRLVAFGALLAVLLGGGALAGAVIDPDRGTTAESEPHEPAEPAHGAPEAGHGEQQAVRGLAVAEHELRLVLETPELARDRSETLRFRVVDAHGATVRDFDVEHERRMHLILARRDLTGFQHLHPRQEDDGTWSTDVRLPAAGSYRVFADFARGDRSTTLAADLRVDGPADLGPLPAPATMATSDGGLEVRLDAAEAQPGEEAELRFTVTKDGRPVETEPYLGAGGHLVALREGDLAFLHVHPSEDDDAIRFAATLPTAGRYRLFLQFRHEGRVHTVAFTLKAG